MSNIIILAGSERKDGNTDMLVDAFKKGAAEKNKVEIISVRSHDIPPLNWLQFMLYQTGK